MYKRYPIALMLLCLLSCEKDFGPISVTIQTINPSAYLKTDGQIEIQIKGGKEPYEINGVKVFPYYYDTVGKTGRITGLASGMYCLTVRDKENNEVKKSVYLASYDTIYPKEYFPVFPGSYWIYTNGDSIFSSQTFNCVGVFHQLRTPSPWGQGHGDAYFPSDSIYLPIWEGYPILEYYKINTDPHVTALIPILQDSDSKKALTSQDARIGSGFIETLVVDTSITINSREYTDVIVTIEGYVMMDFYNIETYAEFAKVKNYYAKNIGLVRVERRSELNEPFVIVKELLRWEINSTN